jgi:hypothetical protein
MVYPIGSSGRKCLECGTVKAFPFILNTGRFADISSLSHYKHFIAKQVAGTSLCVLILNKLS